MFLLVFNKIKNLGSPSAIRLSLPNIPSSYHILHLFLSHLSKDLPNLTSVDHQVLLQKQKELPLLVLKVI